MPSIIERFTAEGVWTSTSAIHLGGDERFGQNADMVLARDAKQRVYIPGSSIAGAARSYLARTMVSRLSDFEQGFESRAIIALFGKSLKKGGTDIAYASLLHVHESLLDTTSIAQVRDRVRLNSSTGSAMAKGKFNLEVLASGANFPLKFQLTLYDELPHSESRESVLDAFGRLLTGFQGEISLGAQTRKGLGAGSVPNWTIRRFEMNRRADCLQWLRHRGWDGGERVETESLLTKRLLPAAERLNIALTLALKGPLLIRGGSAGINSPDTTQICENSQALIPGSSLMGVLRHRAERIGNTLWGREIALRILSKLFGPTIEHSKDPRAGRVRVSEGKLNSGKLAVQSRVKLDRFTGGSIETALFDEAPFWPDEAAASHVDFSISLDAALDEEGQQMIFLLLQSVKDLWLGDLPIGGEVGSGRGIFEGRSALIRYPGLPDVAMRRNGVGGAIELTGWNDQWQRQMAGGSRG